MRENLVLLKTSIAANVGSRCICRTCSLRFRADRAQMQQVVMNLMINAAEAIGTQPGSVAVIVRELNLDAAGR